MVRTRVINIRVDETEYAEIQRRANAANRTVSDYLRLLGLGKIAADENITEGEE